MRKSKSEQIFMIVNISVIVLICILMIYPYLNQLAISLNQGSDTNMGGITIYPRKFTTENYKVVFSNQKICKAAVISVLRVLIGTVLSLIITFSAAYALTRRDLYGRKALTIMFCIPMYITAGLIPTYILYRYLGIINEFAVYIMPTLFSFYNMVIIRSFLQEIPLSLEESALIDGANEVQVMVKIYIPLAKPVLATVALWLAVGHWNDWTTTLMYVTKSKLFTLQYIMMEMIKQSDTAQQTAINQAMGSVTATAQTTSESVKASVLMVSTFPIIMIYPFLQKYFIKGVTLGAVKE